METEDGSLLTLNREYQPVLLRLADDKVEFLPLASLIGRNEIPGQETYLSLAPNGHTAAVIPYGRPFFIIDLATHQIVAELSDAANYHPNVAWSADSRRLAYAGRNGVFIYDLPTGQTRTLVTRQELGFPEDDPRSESDFGIPVWSPDERVVLFAARTPSWGDMTSMEGSHWRNFLFAATSDGSHWRALSRYLIDAMAPDKTRAIVSEWNSEMQREMKYLVDVEWK
jgi:Tol biopolymer transport system component